MLKQKVRIAAISVLSILCVSLLYPVVARASVYGDGSYSSCAYSTGCASSPSSSSASSPAKPAPKALAPVASGTILLNKFSEYFSDGKPLTLGAKTVIYFDVTDSRNSTVRHSITIDNVADDYVDLTLASTPIKTRLYIGDTSQYDVNGDYHNDIQISLEGITKGQASLIFLALATPALAPVAVAKKTNIHFWWWIIIFIILILVGLFIWFYIRRRHKKDRKDQQITWPPANSV